MSLFSSSSASKGFIQVNIVVMATHLVDEPSTDAIIQMPREHIPVV